MSNNTSVREMALREEPPRQSQCNEQSHHGSLILVDFYPIGIRQTLTGWRRFDFVLDVLSNW